MAGDSTQADLEAPPEALPLDDRRMVAAMRVLGCTVEELTAPNPPPPAPRRDDRSPRKVVPVSPNSMTRRQDFWERKQRSLLHEVEELARTMKEQKVAEILAEEVDDWNENALDPTSKLREIKERSQAEIQRAVDSERYKMQKIQECAERHDKMIKQVAAKKAEAHETLLETMQARQAKRDKQGEALKKEVLVQKQDQRKVMKKLQAGERGAAREDPARARAPGAFPDREQEDLVEKYLEKEQYIEERLAAKREKERQRALKGEEEYLEKLEKSLRLIEAEQQKKEADFQEALERQRKGREKVQRAKEEKTIEVHEALEKRFEKRDAVLGIERKNKLVKKRETIAKLKTVLGPQSPNRMAYIEGESRRRIEQREVIDELVQQNRERNHRAEDFTRELLLARIEENNAKVDRRQEEKMLMLNQRAAVLKEAMCEKARVHDELRTMKVIPAPPRESEEKEKEAK
eukprot:CAMPEP_0181480178 /NCGR_PEP_ID=MMETSP1110-20121109/43667_1 /TAXON_ID=174948 /ORGANISM="Symbiodinium sp., Strain CCMP421" /LENGTH=461 /DNA_ID=CAMNT_0023605641 /DNA_START=70 /DNA_END=1456 /DNA_ORIENTATION=+